MVVNKGGGFCELRNTMDLLGQGTCLENANEVSGQKSVCETVEGRRKDTVETLQSAFLRFKRNRQNKLQQLALTEKKLKQNRCEEQIDKLREKFVEQAKTYLGVPYARRYHEPGSPEYDAPLFLDCCGLVRKVLRDMKEDFGFSIGPWNQAYMFDTLPNTIEDIKDMKPGDLVFVSGTFYDPKKRKQTHNMVHVEIWAGDGEKTIGARWQKEKVQIHESYQYVSKSYYNMVYHFKSIDTWLNGTCKSFCSQHPWKSSSHIPGKKSIFSMPQADEPADDFGEEQFSKEIEKSDEIEGNSFGSNRFQKKVDDNDGGTVEIIGNEGKSVRVGTDTQEQKNIVYSEEDIIACKTKPPYVEQEVTKDVVTVEENEPKAYEKKFSQNVISNEGNAVYVGRVTQEENKIYYKEEDILNCKWEAFHVDKEATENFCTLEQNEAKAQETIGLTKKVICNEDGNSLGNMTLENACFCERCVSDKDVLTLEDEESKHYELLHCNQMIKTEVINGNSHLDTLDDGPCISLDTIDQRQFYTDLELSNSSDGVPLDNTLDEVAQVASRPNTGGAEAGSPRKQRLTTQAVNRRGKGGSRRRANGDDDQTNNPREPSKPFCRPNPSLTRLHQKTRTFFIGGHNGAKMVEATLSSLGWKRIYDHNDTTFFLKWVECKRNLDFANFREGEQLVNHIPNGNLLTTKIGLLTSLQEFDRVSNKVPSPNRRVQMKEFVPETFKLQNQTEIDNFIHHIYQDGEMWICKPTGMNQGKGIFLIRSREELLEKLGPKVASQGRQRCFPSPGRVVQRYILNPFLLNGYKADIRTYMLIAGTCPYMVFYHPGYVRLSLVPYSPNQEEVHAHLTNQYIQKKHPLYEQVKEETVWSLEQLQEYINKTSNNTLPPDWVFTNFTKRMQEIMLHCFQSVRYKLNRKLGYFDLLGFDFMLDENLNVWLIEINVNPALHTNCKILSGVIPELVDTTLKLVLEVFEKSKRKEKILPLENLGKFQLIFSDEKK